MSPVPIIHLGGGEGKFLVEGNNKTAENSNVYNFIIITRRFFIKLEKGKKKKNKVT